MFGTGKSVESAIASIVGTSPVIRFAALSTAGTFSADNAFSIKTTYDASGTSPILLATTAVLIMAYTRARVTCTFVAYPFPAMVASVRLRADEVPVVTSGSTIALQSTFSVALPSGLTAVANIAPTGYTTISCVADVSGVDVFYRAVVVQNVTHSGTVTLTLGEASRAYAWSSPVMTSAQIYTFPTGLSATVRFTGASAVAADSAVSALALGARYGTSASTDLVCGEGNTTSIVLTLTGLDATTPHLSEVRPTAAVSCVDSSSTATTYGTMGTYTYDASGHTVDIGELTMPATPQGSGSVKFAVVVTAPDGLTTKLLSQQVFPVISAPTTCVARAISTSGFTCVDGATIAVPLVLASDAPAGMFAFGSDKSVASAIDTITGASPVISFATLSSAGNFSTTGVFTLATTYDTSGTSPLELSTTALLIMARTRARVTCTFVAYPFPAMVTSVRLQAYEVPVVTRGSSIALQSTFSASLPSGLVATARIVPEGSNAIPCMGSVSDKVVSYSVVVDQDVAHSATVTLTLGTASRAYPWESVVIDSSSIYTFPTGLLATVSFTSSNGATADTAVSSLALGASYGSQVGLDVHGDGNATSVVLKLEGYDTSTSNESEIAGANAVSCVYSNGSTLTTYGTMGAYTYDPSVHSVSIKNYTVGTIVPGGTGAIQFAVTVKAPDGTTTMLLSQTLTVISVPTTCTAGTIATSGYACIDGVTLQVPFNLRSALLLGSPFQTGQSLESAVDSITSSSPILSFGTLSSSGNFGVPGSFNLATTYNTLSPVQPICSMDALGKRTAGFRLDSLASYLIVAFPFDDFIEVSHEINPLTHEKIVETKDRSAFVATPNAKYYGGAMFTTQGSSSILVKNMPLGYLSGNFTYEAWIRPTDNSRGGMSIFGSDPSGCGLSSSMLFSTGGQTAQVVVVVGQSASKGATSTTFPITLNQWAHYALTKKGDVYTAYVDGTACLTATDSHPLTGYNQTLNIGGVAIRDDADDFRGYINDARVYTTCKYDGNFIVGEAPSSATATLIMAKTRTRVTCAIPVFTFPAKMESTAHPYTPVVTLGKVLVLTSTFDTALPSGMTATAIITPTGFASVSCNADVSGNRIVYSLAVLHDVTHSAVVTLTLGTTSRSYLWAADVLTRAHIYTFPTGLSATVRFTGSSATVADLDVKALALNASYGTMASASTSSVSSSVCGLGNVSEILLTLTGNSTTAPHASEVQLASDVYCVDSSGSSYGTMAGYTYRASEHLVSIDMFTLPGIMPTPASSAVKFAIIVTAPDGSTSTLLTSQSFHVTRTPVVTSGLISTSQYACVYGSTVPVPFTLRSGSMLQPSPTLVQGLSVASAIDSIAGQGFSFESLYGVAFTSTGTFTLATTYEGGDASGVPNVTLVVANSRARVACALPAYTFPSTVTFSQQSLVVGVDSTISATMSAPGLDGMEWSVQASSGEVAASSGAFSGDETRQITFTYSPTFQVGATGSLSLSWAGFYRTIESTLAVASNISFVVQPLAYDGAVRNFKALADSEITLTINDSTAMSLDASGDYLVTYSQTSPAPSPIYITSPDGSLPVASIVDSSGVILATIDSSGVVSASIERSISAQLAAYSQTSHQPTEIDEMIAAFQMALFGTESGNEVVAVAQAPTSTFGARSYPSMTLAPDALSSYLIVAFPANETVDVSHVINQQTTPKTIVVKDGGSSATLTFDTTHAKYYGRALYNAVGSKLVFVQDLPAAYLAGDFTYEAWIRPTDNRRGGMSIFGSDPFSSGVCSAIWFAKTDDLTYEPSAQVALRVGQRPWVVSSTYPVAIDEWSHYALTKRRSVYKVYINGATCLTTTETTQLGNYNTKLNVGGVGTRLYRPGVATPGLIVLDASGSRVLDEADEFVGCINDVRAYTTCKYNGDFGHLLTQRTVTKTAKARVTSSSTLVVTIAPDLFEPMQITTVVATSYGTVKTLVSNVPTRDFYSFIQPTLISRITQVDGYYTGYRIYTGVPTQMAMNLTPVDGTPGATAVLYQASSMSPSALHTKITDASGVTEAGVLTATCRFQTAGTWYIYALVTSPTGIVASNKVVCTSPVVVTDYTIPTTMTYSAATAVRVGVDSTVHLTFARLYYGYPPSIASAYTSVTYTQPSSASCPSIYVTSNTGAKVGGVASDPFAGWLVLAIPGNAFVDVSYSVNPTSTTKTVTAFGATTSDVEVMIYDKSMHVPGWNTTTGRNTGIKVTGMPPGFLYGDWTVEGWFYLTSTGAALFNLGKCTDPVNISNTLTNPTVRLIVENSVNSWIEVSSGHYYQARFSSTVFTTNQWTHVALVRRCRPGDQGAFSLYVGGSAVSLTVNLATGTRPVGDPGTTMFIGGNDDTNTNTCNMAGYVQDVRFYIASKYAANFSPVTALPVVKTATLVSSTATTMSVTVKPDYQDIIALSVALKGPGASTGTATCILDVEPATAPATTVSARYLRITLFYAGGNGTSGPVFAKLGAYSQASDAYEDTGVSAQNVARTATFISVSGGGVESNTPGAMRACIDDTRTAWTASTTGAVFQATSASGPAYYTMDLGAVRTIGALRFGEVTYEGAGASLFSARLEVSIDSASWDLAHLVNAYGNETQRSVHSGYTLAPPAPTLCVGESLVLAVVSRAYKPTGFTFPTTLGVVSGALHEGRMGSLRVMLPVESVGSRGATAVVAHSASGSDASPVVCGAGTFDASGLSATVTPTIAGSVYLYIKVSAPGGGATASAFVVKGTRVSRPVREADASRHFPRSARVRRVESAHVVVRRWLGQRGGLARDVRFGCRQVRSRLSGDDAHLGDRLVRTHQSHHAMDRRRRNRPNRRRMAG